MKHNKWYIKKGKIGIIKKKDSGTFVLRIWIIRTIIAVIIKPPGADNQIAENTTPEGSSDCLYKRDETLTNFIFLRVSTEHLQNIAAKIGAITYIEAKNAKRAKKANPSSFRVNFTAKAEENTKKADAKIFTLFKLQKPDFSTIGEFGNLLLKYATACSLLASNLGFFSKLVVNILVYLNKSPLNNHIDFNTEQQRMEL